MPQSSLYRNEGDYAYSWSSFWKLIRGEGFVGDGRDGREVDLPEGRPAPERLVGGRATGRLLGGNLTLICSMLGTPYRLDAANQILLIEDTREGPLSR